MPTADCDQKRRESQRQHNSSALMIYSTEFSVQHSPLIVLSAYRVCLLLNSSYCSHASTIIITLPYWCIIIKCIMVIYFHRKKICAYMRDMSNNTALYMLT